MASVAWNRQSYDLEAARHALASAGGPKGKLRYSGCWLWFAKSPPPPSLLSLSIAGRIWIVAAHWPGIGRSVGGADRDRSSGGPPDTPFVAGAGKMTLASSAADDVDEDCSRSVSPRGSPSGSEL